MAEPKSIRGPRATQEQFLTLATLLSQDKLLRNGKLMATFTCKVIDARWAQVAAILNAVDRGATRTTAQWRKVCAYL